nr:MAG: cobalt-zinc-cadmium resistance protein [Dethiosulfovibrio peptidovorans]
MTKSNLRAAAFRLRGGIWTALFLAILWLASPSAPSVAIGLIPVMLGQALRCWAAGCIGRYRGERVSAKRLATWGPYSLCRNPLYVGNGLIGLGWGIMAGIVPLILFALTFWVLYGLLIVPWEERFLLKKFGDAYRRYRRTVGAFCPKQWPVCVELGSFDLSILWRSERHSLLVTLLGTVVLASRLWW